MSLKGIMLDPNQGDTYGSLTIIGRINYRTESGTSTNKCIVYCDVCSKDSELYGEGYFVEKLYRLKQGIKPCGCGIRKRLTEEQYKIVVRRNAEKNGLVFTGWAGDYNNNYTLCKVACPVHGELKPKRLNQFVNAEVRCRKCVAETLEICKPFPDSVMIEKFLSSGSFPENTEFTRSSRKCKRGKRIYWWVSCPDCGETGEATGQDLKQGKRPCNCSVKMPKISYLLLLKDGGIPVAIKFGITSNFRNRLKSLTRTSFYDIEVVGIWEYLLSSECRAAELHCLRSLPCGLVDSILLPSGHTETTSISNIEFISNAYEEYGGIRLTP